MQGGRSAAFRQQSIRPKGSSIRERNDTLDEFRKASTVHQPGQAGEGGLCFMSLLRVAAIVAALVLLPFEALAQKVTDRSLAPITVDPAKVQTPELQFVETSED